MGSFCVLRAAAAVLILAPALMAQQIYNPNLTQIGVTAEIHQQVTGAGVGVAVFDGGPQANHIMLNGNVTVVKPYGGVFNNPLSLTAKHATHLDGIITGQMGVAPDAHIYNYAVLDDRPMWLTYYGLGNGDNGKKAFTDILARNAAGANIRVVNQSFQNSDASKFFSGELDLLDNYHDQLVIVRAAGNGGNVLPRQAYSGAAYRQLNHLILAGSVDANNVISTWSARPGEACMGPGTTCSEPNKLKNFFMVAPGDSIVSTQPIDTTGAWSGTSFSTAHIVGAIALVAEDTANRGITLSPSQLTEAVETSATDLGAPGVDGVYGRGLLNVPAALALVRGQGNLLALSAAAPPAATIGTVVGKQVGKNGRLTGFASSTYFDAPAGLTRTQTVIAPSVGAAYAHSFGPLTLTGSLTSTRGVQNAFLRLSLLSN